MGKTARNLVDLGFALTGLFALVLFLNQFAKEKPKDQKRFMQDVAKEFGKTLELKANESAQNG